VGNAPNVLVAPNVVVVGNAPNLLVGALPNAPPCNLSVPKPSTHVTSLCIFLARRVARNGCGGALTAGIAGLVLDATAIKAGNASMRSSYLCPCMLAGVFCRGTSVCLSMSGAVVLCCHASRVLWLENELLNKEALEFPNDGTARKEAKESEKYGAGVLLKAEEGKSVGVHAARPARPLLECDDEKDVPNGTVPLKELPRDGTENKWLCSSCTTIVSDAAGRGLGARRQGFEFTFRNVVFGSF